MEMIVDQAGQHAAAFQVDDLGRWIRKWHDFAVLPHGKELAILDGDGAGGGLRAIERRDESAMQDQVCSWCSHRCDSGDEATVLDFASAWRPGSWPRTWVADLAVFSAAAQAAPDSISLPTGMTCSPIRIPNSPTSATSGGARDPTVSRLETMPTRRPA